jgi:hypothetical protein
MNIALPHLASIPFSMASWLHAKLVMRPRNSQDEVGQTCADMHFNRAQIREVKNSLGVTLECLSGRVWITQDGDLRDVVLDPGQAFTIKSDQRTLVMALGAARVRCICPAMA